MITAICILSILLITCGFIIYNLLNKLEKTQDELDDVSLSITDFMTDLQKGYNAMKQVDSKGAFEKDDETGTIFSVIKGILQDLNNKYSIEEVTDEK